MSDASWEEEGHWAEPVLEGRKEQEEGKREGSRGRGGGGEAGRKESASRCVYHILVCERQAPRQMCECVVFKGAKTNEELAPPIKREVREERGWGFGEECIRNLERA